MIGGQGGAAKSLDSDGLPAVAQSRPMEIETDYATKLFFPTSSFVQVYFEAVANAFDAGATAITIQIVRNPPATSITISDNGDGFTDERFERFARLKEPSDQYHKGLGRLVYLKYFSRVEVVSVFARRKRSFSFSRSFNGQAPTMPASESEPQRTVLRFLDFHGSRLQSNDFVQPGFVKHAILDEFLPLLHSKKRKAREFRIDIKLTTNHKELFSDPESITTADVPSLDCKSFRDPFALFPSDIEMYYAVRKSAGARLTAISIDGRAIPINNLLSPSAVPADCSYTFLFESDLFAGKSDSARQRLDMPKDIEGALYGLFRKQIAAVLITALPEIVERNARTKQSVEERYPHLTGLFDEEEVGLVDKDAAIEGAQRAFFKKQKEVLEGDALDDATFSKTLDISSRALTEYVLYRDMIIKRLRATSPADREDAIHNIIVPRYRQFNGGKELVDGIYSNNAWLLDDKFMGFRTILSEARMDDVINAITPGEQTDNDGRPDIAMIFSGDPNVEAKVDVVVVEIKKRDAGDKENFHAHFQLLERAEVLAEYWHAIQRIWYFAVIDLDSAMIRRLETTFEFMPLFSRGRILYKEFAVARKDGLKIPTPVYLISYETIVEDASARNHTFLEVLKSDFKKAKPGVSK